MLTRFIPDLDTMIPLIDLDSPLSDLDAIISLSDHEVSPETEVDVDLIEFSPTSGVERDLLAVFPKKDVDLDLLEDVDLDLLESIDYLTVEKHCENITSVPPDWYNKPERDIEFWAMAAHQTNSLSPELIDKLRTTHSQRCDDSAFPEYYVTKLFDGSVTEAQLHQLWTLLVTSPVEWLITFISLNGNKALASMFDVIQNSKQNATDSITLDSLRYEYQLIRCLKTIGSRV